MNFLVLNLRFTLSFFLTGLTNLTHTSLLNLPNWVKSQTPSDTCRNVAYLTTPCILWMKSNPCFSNLKSEYLILYIFLILCFSLKFLTRTSYFPFPLYCILFFTLKGTFSLSTSSNPLTHSGAKLNVWTEIQKSLLEGKLLKTCLVFVPSLFLLL